MTVLQGGRVIARSGSSPHGQGHETTFAQIVAERLGIDPGDVELRFGEIPGVGTFASRSAAMGGSALGQASERILAQATAVAARAAALPGRGARPRRARTGRLPTAAPSAGAAVGSRPVAPGADELLGGPAAAPPPPSPAPGCLLARKPQRRAAHGHRATRVRCRRPGSRRTEARRRRDRSPAPPPRVPANVVVLPGRAASSRCTRSRVRPDTAARALSQLPPAHGHSGAHERPALGPGRSTARSRHRA